MTQVNVNQIVNTDNSRGLKFHYANTISDSISIANIAVTAPGQTADNNYISNFGGFKRLISVEFVLMNDGSDKSTDTSSKVTLKDQWTHLMDNVIQGNSTGQTNVTYTVTAYTADGNQTFTGGIEEISITGASADGLRLSGTLTLQQGTN